MVWLCTAIFSAKSVYEHYYRREGMRSQHSETIWHCMYNIVNI